MENHQHFKFTLPLLGISKLAKSASSRPVEVEMSIKMWPPNQNTRLLLTEKMTKNLRSPSIISRRHGLLSLREAEQEAKKIEESAFYVANEHFKSNLTGDGSSAVLVYVKKSSKLMLEALRKGPRVHEDVTPWTPRRGMETFFNMSKGRRELIDAEEAKDLLQPLTRKGNAYSKICFSNKSFGIEAARVAGPILSSLRGQLKEVDLSDIIAGRPEAEALEVIGIFSSALEGCELRSLDLSNNALGEKGVRAFGALLKSQNCLEELYLVNNGMSEEASQALDELIPSTNELKILHFNNNMTGDAGAFCISEILSRSPLLEDFRCSSTRIGSEGGVKLAESLATCTHLKILDIRDNTFGVEARLSLSKTLTKLVNITELYLSYLNLSDDGAEALSTVLKESAPSLEILEMAGNEITAKAATALANCISTKQFLSTLNLAENELKDEGIMLLAKAIEGHGKLCEVDLSSNSITEVGARVLAQAVSSNPGFKMLNINSNHISAEGLDQVKNILKHCPQVLGPLDENDSDGGGDEDDEESAEGN